MGPFTLPYVLIGVILLGELPTLGRTRAEGRSGDRGSYPLITLLAAAGYGTAFFFAQRSPPLFSPRWYLGTWATWFGSALVLGGTIFRQWAIRTLGRYFTRQVLVSADQTVVENGPYRWVRHPSYTGATLQAAGVGFALGSWPSVA